MFKRQCASPSCSAWASGYSSFCTTHRKAKTRHGDTDQRAVSVARLRPYLAMVEARQKANIESEAWAILTRRWSTLVEDATRTVATYRAGEASVRHQVEAAQQVLNLAGHSDPLKIIATTMAMFMMQESEPRAFASDAGFDYQLVRRVRALAPVNSGTYWSERERRTKRVYRDVPPRTVEVLAWDLKQAFGGAGLQLARLERQKPDRDAEERAQLARAIEKMQ